MTTSNQDLQQTPVKPVSEGGRRRRFLGAGVTAAPLILTMVSQPALGATCFTPSRSLSKNTSLSQQGFYGVCTGAESAGNYKRHQDKSHNAYHWPASVEPSFPFHPLFLEGSSAGVTKFTKQGTNGDVSMSLGEALNANTGGQVHKHIIAAYLNIMGGNNAKIPPNVITVAGVQKIWSEYALKGYYEPMAGVKWFPDQITEYLKSNGIVG
jgi:hypothetical protein